MGLVKPVLGASWYEEDPTVVADVLRASLGGPNPVAEAKLFFLQDLQEEPRHALSNEFLFEKLVVALSGDVPDFESWQPRTTEQIAYAVRFVRAELGEDTPVDRVFPDDVQRYLAASLLNDGCWAPPPTLAFLRPWVRSAMKRRGVDLPPYANIEPVYAAMRSGASPRAPLDLLSQARIWVNSETV